MASPRRARDLVRFVLTWFLLALGAAVASPLIQPQPIQLVCSGSQVKAMLLTEQGAVELDAAQLDCPLCLTVSAPPPATGFALRPAHGPAQAEAAPPAALLSANPALPWQARAPPST